MMSPDLSVLRHWLNFQPIKHLRLGEFSTQSDQGLTADRAAPRFRGLAIAAPQITGTHRWAQPERSFRRIGRKPFTRPDESFTGITQNCVVQFQWLTALLQVNFGILRITRLTDREITRRAVASPQTVGNIRRVRP